MFRLKDNVPEVYVQESRDFQLFCCLYDSIFQGVKYSIDSLKYSTDTLHCDSRTLELLKTKVGLFQELNITDNELRKILAAYPIIMRYKGSRQAIQYIIYLYQRLIKDIDTTCNFNIYNDYNETLGLDHVVYVQFNEPQKYDYLLKDLLSLVIPTGYSIVYEVIKASIPSSKILYSDSIEVYKLTNTDVLDDFIDSNNAEEMSQYETKDSTSIVGLSNVDDIISRPNAKEKN